MESIENEKQEDATELCEPYYENNPDRDGNCTRFMASTPVDRTDENFTRCEVQNGKITNCPIHSFGDYSPPAEYQSDRFPTIPRCWFTKHQPLGDRDKMNVEHIVEKSKKGYNVSDIFRGQTKNRPYFLDYIRLYPAGDELDFDRTKLKYFKLLPKHVATETNDVCVQVTKGKIVSYRRIHPIFIPMCLTWVHAGTLDEQNQFIHVLGSNEKLNWLWCFNIFVWFLLRQIHSSRWSMKISIIVVNIF